MGGGGGNRSRSQIFSTSKRGSSIKGGSPETSDCDNINFNDRVQGLQPVIKDYNVHDVLDVLLDKAERIILTGEHGHCGYLTSIDAISLIECIKQGKRFKAVISDKSTSHCHVTVRPRR